MNYYNEIELSARRWLRELIKDGLIPDGYIDNRPIQEVKAPELREFVQCHFFAGIGGWSYALRLAGVPDDFPRSSERGSVEAAPQVRLQLHCLTFRALRSAAPLKP